MRNKCAPRFKGSRKEISFGRLLLRTEDKQVQLLPDQWKYWREALEIMEYFDVRFCYIRSDAHRSYAIPTRGSIVISAPTSADRMVTIAHEAVHVGLHKQYLTRHREEYETGFLEKLIPFVRRTGNYTYHTRKPASCPVCQAETSTLAVKRTAVSPSRARLAQHR